MRFFRFYFLRQNLFEHENVINLAGHTVERYFKQKCHFFDRFAEKITQLTGKEVSFEPEYYDC
jgi:hypothetical protein